MGIGISIELKFICIFYNFSWKINYYYQNRKIVHKWVIFVKIAFPSKDIARKIFLGDYLPTEGVRRVWIFSKE